MKNLILILAFLEGGLVMLLELLVPSVTMPIFGRSIILWSVVISLSVGSLATGYFLGGRLVKAPGDLKLRIHKLFLINGMSLFVGLLLLTFMNTGADVSYALFTMAITVLILIIPLILFGATTPIIIQVTKASLGEGVVGKIFFYSTIGGVIFCLLTGFYFIPQFGVTKTLILATMLTLLGSFALLLAQNRTTSAYCHRRCLDRIGIYRVQPIAANGGVQSTASIRGYQRTVISVRPEER